MKYPVEPCPKCGTNGSDSEPGQVMECAFQTHNSPLKSEGTICYIRCLHCGHIGPLVLCQTGISERKVCDAWNEHIKPGSSISTLDLVLELSGRDGVTLYADLKSDENVSICSEPEDFGFVEGIEGPAKILVVKE